MAVVLVGVGACGNKVKGDTKQVDAQEAQPVAEVQDPQAAEAPLETVMAPDAALEQGLQEAAQDIKESAKPGPDGDITTESGLKYKVLREGSGRKPTAQDVVKVDYEGQLVDGTVFDSSYVRGESIEFPLNRVIPGWTEGLQLMKEGAMYEFYIPYNLAYGDQGAGPIPPKSDLVFKVELHQVK